MGKTSSGTLACAEVRLCSEKWPSTHSAELSALVSVILSHQFQKTQECSLEILLIRNAEIGDEDDCVVLLFSFPKPHCLLSFLCNQAIIAFYLSWFNLIVLLEGLFLNLSK